MNLEEEKNNILKIVDDKQRQMKYKVFMDFYNLCQLSRNTLTSQKQRELLNLMLENKMDQACRYKLFKQNCLYEKAISQVDIIKSYLSMLNCEQNELLNGNQIGQILTQLQKDNQKQFKLNNIFKYFEEQHNYRNKNFITQQFLKIKQVQ